jgi:hypothetical protein
LAISKRGSAFADIPCEGGLEGDEHLGGRLLPRSQCHLGDRLCHGGGIHRTLRRKPRGGGWVSLEPTRKRIDIELHGPGQVGNHILDLPLRASTRLASGVCGQGMQVLRESCQLRLDKRDTVSMVLSFYAS